MRRGWILFLLAAGAGAQEFSEADLDRAIREVARGEREWAERIAAWGPKAARAAPALVAAWELRRTPGFPDAASAALWAIGPSVIPEVAKVAKGKKRSERAVSLLERFADETPAAPLGAEGEAGLFALLNDTEACVRRAAARGLATRGTPVVARLAGLLADKSPRRREAAALALAHVDPPPEEASGTLLAATRDANEAVRAEAVLAVGRLGSGSKESFAILLAAAADPSGRVAGAALSALEARGKEGVPALLEAWDTDEKTALAATEVLARLGEPAFDQVVEAIRTGGPGARRRYGAIYLGRIGSLLDLSAIERTLIPFLSDPAPEVRLAAAEAFGIALPEIAGRALDALLPAAADADPRVRAHALAAAARGGPGDARVRAAIGKAVMDTAPVVNVTAALLNADAAAAETWARAVENAELPVPARVLASEKLRALPAGFAPVLPALTKVVGDAAQPTDLRASAAYTLRLLLSRRIFEGRYAGKGDPQARAAADRGLRWLAGAQEKDGRWASKAWNDYDLGVTSLALLAFLAAGHTHREFKGGEPYASNVREGLKFVVSCQKDGLIKYGATKQHLMVEHAIATQALCEAVAMTGDRNRRTAAEMALIACELSRNPDLAWRYVPHGGENDTHVTAWMAGTLRVADAAGFTVDPEAFEGTRQWIDKMTEPNFGQIGYDYPGGAPFRAQGRHDNFPPECTQSMTAAGIWCRMILGEDPKTSEMVRRGADLCLGVPPRFDRPGYADFYYWYYGSLACFEVGGVHGTKWETEFKKAVLPRQKPDGSWDPEDAWGFAGGRVYSTAILTLALLTPSRYPRGWGRDGPLPAPYVQAAATLKAAAESGPPRVRAAALGERPK